MKLLLLPLALMLVITGCSKSMDIQKTADKIIADIKFDDELIKASSTAIGNLYKLPTTGVEEMVIYISGSGATANEFALFKLKDDTAVAAVKTALAKRIENLTTNFENYVPDELNRIKKYLILQKGNYLVFAVTNFNEDISDIVNNAYK